MAGAELHGSTGRLTVRRAPLDAIAKQARLLGLDDMPAEADDFAFALRRSTAWDCDDLPERAERDVTIELDKEEAFAVVVAGNDALRSGNAALLLVEQQAGDQVLGGLGLLLVANTRAE
jgi:hypothetical protein